MLGQKDVAKMEKYIDTMPTIIQTHLVTCGTWANTTKKAKKLGHIIRKCDPPAAAMPTLTQDTAVPGLYSQIAQSEDKKEASILQAFKGVKPKQNKTKGGGKGKQQKKQNPPPAQVQDQQYPYDNTTNYYHTENYRGQQRGQNMGQSFRGQNFHGRSQWNQNAYQGQYQTHNYQGNRSQYNNPCRGYYSNNSYR